MSDRDPFAEDRVSFLDWQTPEYFKRIEAQSVKGTIESADEIELGIFYDKFAINAIPDDCFSFLSEILDGFVFDYYLHHSDEIPVTNRKPKKELFMLRLSNCVDSFNMYGLGYWDFAQAYEVMKELKIKPKKGGR